MKNHFTVALAGNPNVGKSTVFNCLTGLHQHTGNWAGKTVENARGKYMYENGEYMLVDLPGTYSLFSHSPEEECAENFISFGGCDAAVVIADGGCLERNLNLVLQIRQITSNVILGVNLMDEAEKNGVAIDFKKLEKKLGVPVVPMSAGKKKGLSELKREIAEICRNPVTENKTFESPEGAAEEIAELSDFLEKQNGKNCANGYYALRILCQESYGEKNRLIPRNGETADYIENLQKNIYQRFGSREKFSDYLTECITNEAEQIAADCVSQEKSLHKKRLEKLDRIFIGRFTGFFTMICLLLLILWLTIYGANYPSEILSAFLLGLEDKIAELFLKIGVSATITDMLIHGGYRVLAWVVSVMLPPMAIFFPLFTLLEDFGYLPRVAFNLDYYFKKADTCGKQALTMCMGFGCNAVGVTGCRIIDSPRERLIAILTNSFVPCNGRFPPPTVWQLLYGCFQDFSQNIRFLFVRQLHFAEYFCNMIAVYI